MVAADDNVVRPDINALWAYPRLASRDKALAVFDNGGHSLFLRPTHETAALTTAFFLDILKGDLPAKAALMTDAVTSPGVTYDTTLH